MPKKREARTPTAWETVVKTYDVVKARFPSRPTASSLQHLLDLTAFRPLVYNPRSTRRADFGMPVGSSAANRNVKAALQQVSGLEADTPCTRCSRNQNLWDCCVIAPGNPYCAGCAYNGQEGDCSLVSIVVRVRELLPATTESPLNHFFNIGKENRQFLRDAFRNYLEIIEEADSSPIDDDDDDEVLIARDPPGGNSRQSQHPFKFDDDDDDDEILIARDPPGGNSRQSQHLFKFDDDDDDDEDEDEGEEEEEEMDTVLAEQDESLVPTEMTGDAAVVRTSSDSAGQPDSQAIARFSELQEAANDGIVDPRPFEELNNPIAQGPGSVAPSTQTGNSAIARSTIQNNPIARSPIQNNAIALPDTNAIADFVNAMVRVLRPGIPIELSSIDNDAIAHTISSAIARSNENSSQPMVDNPIARPNENSSQPMVDNPIARPDEDGNQPIAHTDDSAIARPDEDGSKHVVDNPIARPDEDGNQPIAHADDSAIARPDVEDGSKPMVDNSIARPDEDGNQPIAHADDNAIAPVVQPPVDTPNVGMADAAVANQSDIVMADAAANVAGIIAEVQTASSTTISQPAATPPKRRRKPLPTLTPPPTRRSGRLRGIQPDLSHDEQGRSLSPMQQPIFKKRKTEGRTPSVSPMSDAGTQEGTGRQEARETSDSPLSSVGEEFQHQSSGRILDHLFDE